MVGLEVRWGAGEGVAGSHVSTLGNQMTFTPMQYLVIYYTEVLHSWAPDAVETSGEAANLDSTWVRGEWRPQKDLHGQLSPTSR